MITEKELKKEVARISELGTRKQIPIENGLVLDVLGQGRGTWRFRFREHGKSHKVSIGAYPLISLKYARAKRDELRLRLLNGESLVRPQRTTPSLEQMFEEWVSTRIEPLYTPKYLSNVRIRMRPLLAKYGGIPVDEVRSVDILEVIREVEKAGHYDAAHRLKQAAGQMFRYAMASGIVEADPTYALAGAMHPKNTKHYPRITEPDRVGQLMRDIRDKGSSPVMRIFLQMHAYTFVRPKEIREAEWTEFDFDKNFWRIPAEKMKMRRLHIVPLARQVLELLTKLKVMTGHGRYLFPAWGAMDGSRHISENTENKALRDRGYLSTEMVGHGFRGMASTLLHNSGLWPSQVIEIQLSHLDSNSVRESYNDADYMERRIEMMQWYADYLDELMMRPLSPDA